jgi:hypothetical protein
MVAIVGEMWGEGHKEKNDGGNSSRMRNESLKAEMQRRQRHSREKNMI